MKIKSYITKKDKVLRNRLLNNIKLLSSSGPDVNYR